MSAELIELSNALASATERAATNAVALHTEVRGSSSERPQRLRCLFRRFDLHHAVGMECRRRSQDDEVHHEIRCKHSRQHIHPQPPQVLVGRAFPLGICLSLRSLFFYLLRCLPIKKVRRNRRAQNPHHHSQ